MKCVQKFIFYQNFLFYLSRRISYGNVFCAKHKRKNKKNSIPTGFAPHFESKMQGWQKQVELELKARLMNDHNKNLFSQLSSLKLKGKSISRNVSGNVLELTPSLDDKSINDEEISIALSILNKGAPIVLKKVSNDECLELNEKAEKKSDTSKNKKNEDIHGILLGSNENNIQIKITNRSVSLFDIEDMEFQILPANEYTPFDNLLKLLSNRKEWSKFPGYKLLLYAYRARQLPLTYTDRPITLPKEFNADQVAAIAAGINSKRPLTAIQGPPGTGKTKVIVEIIAELVRQKKKILVCAPSHKALLNILVGCKLKNLDRYCKIHGKEDKDVKFLSSLIEAHPYYIKLQNCYSKINKAIEENTDNENCKILTKKANSLERHIQASIAESTKILFCTLTSCSVHRILDLGFEPDITIIDEAGQSFECETWPMIFQATRALIVGDHNQIPPLIISNKAKEQGMNISLTETLLKEFGNTINFPLRVQYRSNDVIQRWSSIEFYNNNLRAHSSCVNISLKDLIGKSDWTPTQISLNKKKLENVIDDPLVLVNTDLIFDDLKKKESNILKKQIFPKAFNEHFISHSAVNPGEAKICAKHIETLVQSGLVHPALIGCITPYLAQTHEIAKNLPNEILQYIDISSVDAFQGQEREVIVMSFVRNNKRGSIGFLEDIRRLNVAITRAKRQFFLVASLRMMKTNPAIERLYNIIRNEGRIISPLEFFINKNK